MVDRAERKMIKTQKKANTNIIYEILKAVRVMQNYSKVKNKNKNALANGIIILDEADIFWRCAKF